MPMHAIQLKGLDHVVLRVHDLSRSVAFYTSVLGCAEERRIQDLGLVQLCTGASLIDLVGIDTPLSLAGGDEPEPQGRNLDHFALALDRFDADLIRAHLAEFGVESPKPEERYGASGLGLSIYIRDPDGNTIELKGPPVN